ncbi:MAG TPA: hypothetical protein VFN39_08965 [Gemmatimonadaceae bacterium]|nr:hypothetical protein [Gemmatimonadaceae bacterium]
MAAALFLACAPKQPPTLAALCSGGTATARIAATIDTTRPPAGPELAAAKGTRFELTFTFAAPATRGADSHCTGTAGTAIFSGALPERLRPATSSVGRASWRIDGETVLLDLNPGTRDNNVFVALPLNGGRGHWGLSTFAGEVAAGGTAFLP